MTEIVKVRVLAPFQAVYEGTVYRPGDVAEIPLHIASMWLNYGWVTKEVTPDGKSD
jgi:hypothetical protein